jgi:hypothetical protein
LFLDIVENCQHNIFSITACWKFVHNYLCGVPNLLKKPTKQELGFLTLLELGEKNGTHIPDGKSAEESAEKVNMVWKVTLLVNVHYKVVNNLSNPILTSENSGLTFSKTKRNKVKGQD